MKKLITLTFLLLLAGCTSTHMSSFTDPSFDKNTLGSVIVMGWGMTIEERQIMESTIANEFIENNINALQAIDFIPPTRQYTSEQIAEILFKTGADGILIIYSGEKYTTSYYIPPTVHQGSSQTTGTVSTFGNTATVTATTTYSPTYTTGGGTIEKPRAVYSAQLYDRKTGTVLWQADALARGGALTGYIDLAKSMGRKTVKQLIDDGLYPATPE